MLSGIKDKILNVTKTVNFLSGDEHSWKQKEKSLVNYNAGAPILQHFQDQWEVLHKFNEDNARLAAAAAETINKIVKKVSSDKQNMQKITHVLNSSNLTTNISHCMDHIDELYNLCDIVERGLCTLENLMEQVEFEKMKRQHRHHLYNYKKRKEEAIHTLKCSLQKDYDKKLHECEASKTIILEERQKVFQEAFKSDLEVYKSLGTIPKVNIPKTGALLEEIQLDFDESELDQFFNSSGESNNS